jgi:SAM-dependent methyltransferase
MAAEETTAAIYDRAAGNWARKEPVLLSDYTARPFLLDWCEPLANTDVLDLGCGEGYVARQLRRRGARAVHGIDVSAEMVRKAQAAEAEEPQGITFAVGDARQLQTIGDASLDRVVAVFLFNYLDKAGTAEVMRQVHRVLKPGARFVFSVPHPSLPFLRREEPPFYFARQGLGYFSAQDVTLEGRIWRRDGVDVPVRCVHKTLQDYFECLGTAGFRELPELLELRVRDEHVALDPGFFGPLHDLPLHLAFRIHKARA